MTREIDPAIVSSSLASQEITNKNGKFSVFVVNLDPDVYRVLDSKLFFRTDQKMVPLMQFSKFKPLIGIHIVFESAENQWFEMHRSD